MGQYYQKTMTPKALEANRKNAMSENIGRPLIFKEPAELEKKIQEYISKRRSEDKRLTLAGMSEYIGFSDSKTLRYYEKRDGFYPIIKKARLACEAEVEERLVNGTTSPVGSIFWLKNNAGYVDKQEIEHSGTINIVSAFDEIDNNSIENDILEGEVEELDI